MSGIIKQLNSYVLLVVGVMISLSIIVSAQSENISVEKQIKVLKAKLNLGQEQIKKITVILEDQREEITTAKNDNRGNSEALQTVIQDIKVRTDDLIRSVLTDDQLIIYDKWQKELLPRMGRRAKARSKK